MILTASRRPHRFIPSSIPHPTRRRRRRRHRPQVPPGAAQVAAGDLPPRRRAARARARDRLCDHPDCNKALFPMRVPITIALMSRVLELLEAR
jgi:hypothetical protein